MTLRFEIHPDFQDVETKVLRTTDFSSWTVVATKTGAGAWAGTAEIMESPAQGGRMQVSLFDDDMSQATSAFYRLNVKKR